MLDALSTISTVVLLLNCIIYFKSFSLFPKAFKVFSYYLAYILIIQLITIILNRLKQHNIFLSHYYFIGQYLFLATCFYFLFRKKKFKNLTILFSILIVISLIAFYIVNPQRYFSFNLFEIFSTSIPLIIYCLIFFISKIDNTDKQFIYITSGFFIYILCSTLLFATGDIASIDKITLWTINAFIYLVYQILIFIEWYKHIRGKGSILE